MVINTANLSGENFTATNTSEAVVVVDPFGVVYAGHSGGAVRIGGARVSLLTDEAGNPLQLPPDVGFVPNEPNVNPFSTDAQGRFAFALTPAQLGTPNQPARYLINVTAPGYRGRLLEITLRPAGGVFEMTVRALDGQPLARGGSFALADTETVLIEDIASIALNIPLFEVSALEITKTADKQTAEVGDLITYRVAVRNATASPMSDVVVRDGLPPSFHYVEGTGRIETGRDDARDLEPEIAADGQLNFRLGRLDAGAGVTFIYRVRIGANAQDGDQFNSAVASSLFPSGERTTTPAARAGVRVGRGVFSTRQFIIGRVFEDKNNNGQFDAGAGERPVAGVRLYLNNGQSVITDSAGQYNIPSIGEGAFVISLDPVTVPNGYLLADEGRRAGRSWTRLLRTPLGGGALLRQNFALIPPAEGGETGRRGDGET
ncbi:MAG: DUF11 domain-containing protein [Acidobacteria bacterium]|nr:DUF11 domain-containing protein [Acidobacteriota bacterium]